MHPFAKRSRLRLPLLPCAALTLLLWCCPAYAEQPEPARADRDRIATLRKGDIEARQQAALALSAGDGPSLRAVPSLLKLVEQERDAETYRALLIALGKTGAMEARPPIDRHILSPDKRLRDAARSALRHWLVRNGLRSPDSELPPPPHALYGPPPPLPPVVPAGHELSALLDTPEGEWMSRSTRQPRYKLPSHQQPYGLHSGKERVAQGFVATERPQRGLAISGGAILGSTYGISLAAGAAMATADEAYLPMLIPVVGPFVTIVTTRMFNPRCGSEEVCPETQSPSVAIAGPALILDGLAQLAGLTLLTAGFVSTDTVVVRDDDKEPPPPQLQVSAGPGSVQLRYRF